MGRVHQQRGVVLFFALIALVVMSLAAVGLIRSVDTNTLIAGNLASRQAATTSGDAGVEAGLAWLDLTETNNHLKNVYQDPAHAFNITDAASGYYSNADPALNLFAKPIWDAITNILPPDNSGNEVRYIVQRMCRTANQPLSTANCLFSSAVVNNNNQIVPLYSSICSGPGCPTGGQSPVYRVTARVTGPKATVSYIQAFLY